MNYFKIKADTFAMKKAKKLASVNGISNIYETNHYSEPFEIEMYLKSLEIKHQGVSKMNKK